MTRLSTTLFACMLFASAQGALAQQQKPSLGPLSVSDCSIGVVTIAIGKISILEGGECEVDYTFYAPAYSQVVYNPFFSPHLEPPGTIVVSNSDGVVLNDAIQFCMASRKLPTWDDWVRVPYGSHIGARIAFRMAKWCGGHNLAPGHYRVQLHLNKSFIARRPRPCTEPGPLPEPFDRTTLCSSNVVDVEVVAPAAAPN